MVTRQLRPLSLLALIVLMIGLSPDPTAAQSRPFNVYNNPSFAGGWCFSDTPMTANIFSTCNDQISSVQFAAGWSARLYRDQNQGGPSFCLSRNDADLGDNTFEDGSPANDAISSFVLYNQPWCGGAPTPAQPLEVFNDPAYAGGWCYSWRAETANIFSGCDNQISSVLLRAGWSVRVYRDQNQAGPSRCLTASDNNLADNTFEDGSAMNDAISSFALSSQASCPSSPPTPTPTPPTPTPGAPIGPLPPKQPQPQPARPTIFSATTGLGNVFFIAPNLPLFAQRNDYTLEVDWNGSDPGRGNPGRIIAQLNGNDLVFNGPYSGGTAKITLDMRGRLRQGFNKLNLYAETGSGRSAPFALEVYGLPDWPAWMFVLAPGRFDTKVEAERDFLRYSFKGIFPDHDNEECEITISIPEWVPFVGGTTGLPRPQAEFEPSLTSRGEVKARLSGQVCFSLKPAGEAKRTITGRVYGEASGYLDTSRPELLLIDKGKIGFELKGKIKIERGLVQFIPQLEPGLRAPIIGQPLRWLNERAKVYGQVEPSLDLNTELTWRDRRVNFQNGEGELGLGIEVGANLNIVSGLKASLSGGGEATAIYYLPPNPRLVKELKAKVYGKLEAEFGPFKRTFEASHEWTAGSLAGLADADQMLVQTEDSGWVLAPRSYLSPGAAYARFNPSADVASIGTAEATLAATETSTILSNVYPQASPALAVWGSANAPQALLVWVHDDAAKPLGLGTELRYSRYNGSAWSAPISLTDDATPDFRPRLAPDGAGRLVLVWERIVGATAADPFDNAYAQKVELAYAAFDIASGGWSPIARLTTNTALDFEPRLAAGPSGGLTLAWLQNESGSLSSSPDTPHRLLTARWDGSGWQGTQQIADQVSQIAIGVFGPGRAGLLAVRDADGDAATSTDQGLLFSTWNGGSWGALAEISSAANLGAPQIFYTSGGEPVLVWKEGVELVSRIGGTRTVLATDTLTGLLDSSVILTPNDTVALIYQAPSAQGVDLFQITYDAAAQHWGEAVQVTANREAESVGSLAIDQRGRLWLALTTAELVTETATVGATQVDNVTAFGRRDLQVVTHLPERDLRIEREDVVVATSFIPGGGNLINVTVHNGGDLTAEGVIVELRDNDVPVAQQTVATLRAGTSATVALQYTAPNDGAAHVLTAVADPAGAVAEEVETNNTASFVALGPNLTISEVQTTYDGEHTAQVVVTVGNRGFAAAPPTLLQLSLSQTTQVVASVPVPALAPGQATTVTGTVSIGSLAGGSYPIRVLLDSAQAVAETNEEDNSSPTEVRVGPDLAIQADDVQLFGPTSAQIVVRNLGNRPASGWRLTLLPADNAPAQTPLWERLNPETLPPGQAITLTVNVDQPLPEQFRVWADPDGQIFETAEWNNLYIEGVLAPAVIIDRVFLPVVKR